MVVDPCPFDSRRLQLRVRSSPTDSISSFREIAHEKRTPKLDIHSPQTHLLRLRSHASFSVFDLGQDSQGHSRMRGLA